MKQKFFTCQHCGNIITLLRDSGVPVYCCGEKMQEIVPGTTDASQEKHVPVWHTEGNKVTVKVGEQEHPMTPDHYIEWICLQTKEGSQYKRLNHTDPPQGCFALCEGDEVEEVFAFCNLHSLWES